MKHWKILGLAGLAGVTATGVVIARKERARTQLSADDVRARLQARYEQATEQLAGHDNPPVPTPQAERPRRLRAMLRRRHRQ